jgi:pimeloyl-ACP methyl ester carboxylesterase
MLFARTPTLDIAYEATGLEGGSPVILMHGFPDDARAYDECVGPLAEHGCRVLVPYLRGYGPTRFLDPATPRSGQLCWEATTGAGVRPALYRRCGRSG